MRSLFLLNTLRFSGCHDGAVISCFDSIAYVMVFESLSLLGRQNVLDVEI